jgi:hypothetical protein
VARPSDPRFLVLHELRVKGLAVPDDPHGLLPGLAADGLVQQRTGVVSGWRLTPAGRVAHEVAAAADVAGVRPVVEAAHARFLGLNPDLLAICSDWQLRSDPAVRRRLDDLHERALPVVDDLAAALDRFAGYRPRLTHAAERVRAGDLDHLSRPLLDSYHTVWSELHEDLLASLGIARGSERLPTPEVA